MLDHQEFKHLCPCQHCQRARGLGLKGDTHRYDDIHAEDVSWAFKVFCRCRLCREERRRLALREIRAEQ